MNFIDKLEQRFGHLGIPNLMYYIVGLNIVGVILNLIAPEFCQAYLTLDIYQILHGQIWRLVTFIFATPIHGVSGVSMESFMSLLWFALWVYVYYFIGRNIENMWGSFRFTLFMLMGVLFVIIVTFISYFSMGELYSEFSPEVLSYYMAFRASLEPLYSSLFLAFALLFPDVQFLVYFIVPVKAKWLAALYLVMDIYQIYNCIQVKDYFTVALIVGAVVNVTLFYVFARGTSGVRGRYRQKKRSAEFRKKVRKATPTKGTVHRCAICGRTEQEAPNLEFRYCSKCNGSYEYCSDHLFTHEHVR